MRAITRREAIRVLGAVSAGAWVAACDGLGFAQGPKPRPQTIEDEQTPPLAPGAPMSPERTALIKAFKQQSNGLQNQYEARSYKGDFTMPYRLFRPAAPGKLPLVLYLHGSGGLGDDNQKQLEFGNIFGTRVWLLPENQKKFPCYVVVPQTDRGWVRYDLTQENNGSKVLPGVGDGNRVASQVVDALIREFPIDARRIYVTGQSMGGAGVWNIIAYRPHFFAAAVPCCASISLDDGAGSPDTAVWARFTVLPTRPSPSLSRASASRRDAKRADVRFTPSTPTSITRFGSGHTLSPSW
jgi:poly(3-hydroxybutyrate) depolymerase